MCSIIWRRAADADMTDAGMIFYVGFATVYADPIHDVCIQGYIKWATKPSAIGMCLRQAAISSIVLVKV